MYLMSLYNWKSITHLNYRYILLKFMNIIYMNQIQIQILILVKYEKQIRKRTEVELQLKKYIDV